MQPETTNYMENADYSGFSCINVATMDYTCHGQFGNNFDKF